MATSSIAKNFVVSGAEQVEMFADAIEESICYICCPYTGRRTDVMQSKKFSKP